ncbi:MAG: hypothetical protein R6V05_05975 [Candidatus Brocadiia bacterium]
MPSTRNGCGRWRADGCWILKNALYDYLLAYTLLVQATEVADKEGITVSYRDRGWHHGPDVVERDLPTLRVTDRELFLRGVRAARVGFARRRCTPRVDEWAARMQGLWAEPRTYRELLSQWGYHAGLLMPHLAPMRVLSRRLPGMALLLAEMGRRDEAVRLARSMERPGIQMGADARLLISTLVARVMHVYTAGAAPQVLEALGEPEAADAAEQAFQGELDAYAAAVPARGHADALEQAVVTEGGVVAQATVPALPGLEVQPLLDTTRLAEHVLLERIVLAGLLVLGSAALLALAGASAWSGWRHPGEDERPLMLFVGWRRLGVTLLFGLALPIALYALQTRVAPWRSLRYGVPHLALQRAAELGISAVLIVSLTGVFAHRAVRRRCEEAGLPVPPRGWFNPLRHRASAALSLLLAGAFGAAVAGIVAGPVVKDVHMLLGVVGIGAAVTVVPIFVLWQLAHLGYAVRPFGAVAREALSAARRTPIWLIAGGLVLLGGGGLLLWSAYAIRSWIHLVIVFGAAIVLPLIVYGCARTQFVAPDAAMARFRRTAFRSLLPVAAASVVLLGLLANLYLAHAEAAALEPVNRIGYQLFSEVEDSDLANYREHLQQVSRRWLRVHSRRPASGAE